MAIREIDWLFVFRFRSFAMPTDSSRTTVEKQFSYIAEKIEAGGVKSASSGDISNVLSNEATAAIEEHLYTCDRMIADNQLPKLLMERSPRELILINNGLRSASSALNATADNPAIAVLDHLIGPPRILSPSPHETVDSARAADQFRRNRDDPTQHMKDQEDLDKIMQYDRKRSRYNRTDAVTSVMNGTKFIEKLLEARKELLGLSQSLAVKHPVIGKTVENTFDPGKAANIVGASIALSLGLYFVAKRRVNAPKG